MALVRRDWPDLQDLVQRWFEGDVDKSWLRVAAPAAKIPVTRG